MRHTITLASVFLPKGGIRFNFLKNQDGSNWFIEPQVQLSYYRLLGEDLSFSHGMKVKIDDSDSLNMRLGLTAAARSIVLTDKMSEICTLKPV